MKITKSKLTSKLKFQVVILQHNCPILETVTYDFLWVLTWPSDKFHMYAFLLFVHQGVITPNQIPLTTIVTYLQKGYRSRISNHWPLYLHAVWYLPFTNSPRKHTVTYYFSNLQEVYSGNHQIHTKCQLQYLHPPQISTSGKYHYVIIHQTTKATEYIG